MLKLLLMGLGGLAVVLPFILLEIFYARTAFSEFPVVLFTFIWALSTAFVAIVLKIVRNFRRPHLNPLKLLLPVAAFMAVAFVWLSIVLDQMPCFLGVPNCD